MPDALNRQLDALWRIDAPRIIGAVMRVAPDLTLAEEAVQDAFAEALIAWPHNGAPASPTGWLITTARRRAIDELRRRRARRHFATSTSPAISTSVASGTDAIIDGAPADDVLRLIFMACHPILPTEARAALALRLVGGLTVPEIARAYLSNEATIAQRIVRAKRKLAHDRVAFEVPAGSELPRRLGSVLEVIYLVFNEGYAATAGANWTRPTLSDEALRLGRILAARVPLGSPNGEAHGLLALMELQSSRMRARADAEGNPVLLRDQDRSRWDRLSIRRGLAALELARRDGLGVYGLQAEIAACHARATTTENTDWPRIVALYTQLYGLAPSPVVGLSVAIAVGMAGDPAAGLRLVEALAPHPALADYHLVPAARAEFLQQLGRNDEARRAFERAAEMSRNEPERRLLLRRAATFSAASQPR